MKVIVGSEEKISALIAEEFIKQVNAKPNSVLGLATGTSPLGVYANLVKANKEGRVTFKDVATFNLDEYIGLEGTHNQSYRYFMNVNLFDHIDIDKNRTHVLKGVGDYLWGNPSSLHTVGQEAKVVLEDARAQIAASLGAEPREIKIGRAHV